jgi:HPt (histidine-containing phosphotransfer) domain-containing protein
VTIPVADLKALEEELDEECARELAAAFLEDSATSMSGIAAAIGNHDSVELKSHAHGLKGCCRTIKAARAEQVCTELESAAIAQDWEKITPLLSQLNVAYVQVCHFINGYLGI